MQTNKQIYMCIHNYIHTKIVMRTMSAICIGEEVWRRGSAVPRKVIHFTINYWPTRGSISPCNIAGVISIVFKEVATKSPKIAVVDNHTVI